MLFRSAFIATCLSFPIRIFESIFESIPNTSLISVSFISFFLFGFCLLTSFLGDFWMIWIFFHLIFLLPGIILHPTINKWLHSSINNNN